VLLSTSVDHGRSFRAPTTVDANSADDKPFIAVRSIPGKRASVAISWTRWLAHSSEIWVGQSSNGGDSFNRPRRLFASSKNNFGSVPLFGQDGSLYVFWSNFDQRPLGQTTPTHILMKVSRDGGAHFGAIHSVSPWFSGIPQMAQPGSMRSLTMPAAVGEKDGAIDVAWAQVSHSLGGGRVDADIELTRSRDGGKTWSAPRRINDSRRGDRFMPTMTALDDGSLAVAFYDRRRSPYDLDVEAVRVSYHGGFHQTANIRVNQSDAPIASIFYIKPGSTCFSPGRFFGDYIGAAGCAPNTACIVWADTQRRIQDETDIWFARMRLDGLYH
jgi:hypothetical protein